MSVERVILIAAWLAAASIFIVAHKRGRLPEALIQLLATQTLTWTLSLLFVNLHLIENPVREFPHATESNFTFNYMFYPSINVLFSLFYPKGKGWLTVAAHHVVFTLGMYAFTYAVELHTQLIHYTNMPWYLRVLSLWLGLNATRFYGDWFFKAEWRKSRGTT